MFDLMYPVACAIFLVGSYLLLTAFLPAPSRKMNRTVVQYGRRSGAAKKSLISLDIPVSKLASMILPLIRLSSLRRVQLSNALRDAGNPLTAEEYAAHVAAGFAIFFAAGLPFLPFAPIITAALVLFAAYYAISAVRELYRSGKLKSKAIETELPRFATYIKQSLTNNRNALLLLERYKTENTAFADDLNRTIADIKTSNFETGLLRMNSRYNSEHLSMIIHGLIGIFNGDDVRYYFELLEKDFTEIEINRLRREIKKIPGKMRTSMVVLYTAIALMFFTPILILIFDNLLKFFA